jgi:hypothetical protein
MIAGRAGRARSAVLLARAIDHELAEDDADRGDLRLIASRPWGHNPSRLGDQLGGAIGRIVAALEAKPGQYPGEEDLVDPEEWL